MYSKEALKKVIPLCRKKKIEVWGRMPLAKGLLTGKYKSLKELRLSDERRKKESKISSEIITFCLKKKINTYKAFKWTAKHSDKVVIGFKNIDQMQSIIN